MTSCGEISGRRFELSGMLFIKSFLWCAEFLAWKAKEEKRSHSLFTTVSGAHKLVNGLERTYYLCNRSGFYKPKGHAGRRAKATGSRKMNAYCTAKIALTVRKNEIGAPCEWDVHYTATHYGHDVDVEHLNLTKPERDTIASLLRQGTLTFCRANLLGISPFFSP